MVASFRRIAPIVLLVAGLLLSQFVVAAPAGTVPRAISQRVLQLTAADGHSLPALATFPAGGMNVDGPVIVHCQGGPGATPLEGSGVWIAQGLAARGYTVIAPMVRHGDQLFSFSFEQLSRDVGAAVDLAASLGFRDIILAGSSFGSITVTRYMTERADPRVKAMLHFAPTADMDDFVRRGMGEQAYWKAIEAAGDLVSAGRGDTVIAPAFDAPPPFPKGVKVSFTHTARAWLDLWGPASTGVNTLLFPRLRVPMLLLLGDKDGYNDAAMLANLKARATASPRVDTRYYEGGVNHSFYPAQVRVVADVGDWLSSVGLAARPAVSTEVVVINEGRMGEGTRRGVRYSPTSVQRTARSRVFLLVHDWGDDALHGPSQWLGPALAQQGAVALSINAVRGPGELMRAGLADSDAAIRDWTSWLRRQGHSSVVLVGHGYGVDRVAHYLAGAPRDGARVDGVVQLAPRQDAPAWLRAQVGDGLYAGALAETQRSIENGDDLHVVQVAWRQSTGEGRQIAMFPKPFLAAWGPDAFARSAQAAVPLPHFPAVDELRVANADPAIAAELAAWASGLR